ncbi:hypothetical protein KAW65_02370 [candidate division WOR-3 bacterium]|nr:hypothetical protein [candidate division WOR-3 bacterium]
MQIFLLIVVLSLIRWTQAKTYPTLIVRESLPKIEVEPFHFFPYRGIYLNHYRATRLKEYLPHIDKTEINCIVVDFKEARGMVTYNTNVEFAKTIGARKPYINLERLLSMCKSHGLRLIGRVVVFQDSILACYNDGEYSMKSLDGRIWKDGHGRCWTNPCLKEVQKYNIEIAKDLTRRGVPEIQFDYIRFPSKTGRFRPYKLDCEDKTKVIASFLKLARQELKPLGATIAGDVYGYALWYPLKGEGQNLRLMAKWLDIINPMLYPSHFHKHHEKSSGPGKREYNLIFKSIVKGEALIGESLSASGGKFVPYIQGFNLKSPNFGPDYIANQIEAVRNSRAWGYIVWNSRGKYKPLWELLER